MILLELHENLTYYIYTKDMQNILMRKQCKHTRNGTYDIIIDEKNKTVQILIEILIERLETQSTYYKQNVTGKSITLCSKDSSNAFNENVKSEFFVMILNGLKGDCRYFQRRKSPGINFILGFILVIETKEASTRSIVEHNRGTMKYFSLFLKVYIQFL